MKGYAAKEIAKLTARHMPPANSETPLLAMIKARAT
jgi:hypothetical protein